MKKRPIILVDLYCGCGGFTTGAHEAFGELGLPFREIAINHWLRAIQTMQANHPDVLALKRDSPDRFPPGHFLDCMPMRRLVKRTKVAEAKPVAAEERPKVEVKETPKAVNVRALAQAEFDFG